MNAEDWRKSHTRISALQQHDAKLYRKAAWVFIGVAVVLLFIFPFGSLVPLVLSAYLFYNARNNDKKMFAYVIDLEISKKRCYYYPESEPETNRPANTNPTLFVFDIRVTKTKQLSEAGLHDTRPKSNTWIKVNSGIYQLYKPADKGTFIMSAADDLIGYVWNDETVLLTGKHGDRTISFTIPQTVVWRDAVLSSEETKEI